MPKRTKDAEGSRTAHSSTIAHISPPISEPFPGNRIRLSWATLISGAIALFIVASTIAAVVSAYTPLPRWDHWNTIQWLNNYYAGAWHISDLWSQHNEHRIFFPRLFLLADLLLFHGTNVFLLCSILLLQTLHAGIFIREVRNWNALSRSATHVVIAIIVVLFFSGANLENFVWPFQISFILVLVSATLSIYTLCLYTEEVRLRNRAGTAAVYVSASLAFAVIATYSLASGILIWPVLALMAVVLKAPIRILTAICITGALATGLYLHGYHAVSGHTNMLTALTQPGAVLAYMCAYLALPLSKLNHDLGTAAGFAVFVLVLYQMFRLFRRPRLPRVIAISTGMILFITAGSFMTALGRMSLGPPEVAMRYGTPVSILWVCILLVLIGDTTLKPKGADVKVASTISAAATCMITVILPLHVQEFTRYRAMKAPTREVELAIITGVAATAQIATVFPDPQFVTNLFDVLREHHLSIFSSPQIIGDRLDARYQAVSRSHCRGFWETTAMMGSAEGGGESAAGWAWDSDANQRPKAVLIVGASGRVRGEADITRPRPDVATAFGNMRMADSGWFGFARRLSGDEPYHAYAVLNDGKSVCPIDSIPDTAR